MGFIIGFHTKRILRSPFFLAGVGCLLAFWLFFEVFNVVYAFSAIHYVALYSRFAYFEMSLMPVLFCIGVHYTRQTSSLEIAGMHSPAAIVAGKMIATVCASLFLYAIPVLFVIIHAIAEGTGFGFNLAALVYILIRWAMIIFAIEGTAFLCAFLIRTPLCYVLCLPATILFSFFNRYLFSAFAGPVEYYSTLPSLFSMQAIPAEPLDYTGATTDLFLLSKLLYAAIFLGIMLSIIWLCASHRKALPALLLVILLLAETGSIYAWAQLSPTSYTPAQKLYVTDYPAQAATVRSYSGELYLSEFSRFNCDLEILPAGQRSITFRLDESLSVQSLTWNGQKADYTRNKDELTVHLSSASQAPATLSIQYSGRIYYGSVTVDILATSSYAALPPRFAFLPIIDGADTPSQYNLQVHAGNTVISNLDVEQLGWNKYALTGQSKTICLFSGYFAQYEKDDVIFYRAKYNQVTDYDDMYQRYFVNFPDIFDPYTGQLIMGAETKPQPKKVFLIYSMYGILGPPIAYEDYILLNYGFASA